jgi:hypothetical protein
MSSIKLDSTSVICNSITSSDANKLERIQQSFEPSVIIASFPTPVMVKLKPHPYTTVAFFFKRENIFC